MALVKFEQKVIPLKKGEETRYSPAYVVDGNTHFIRWQGRAVHFETPQEALEYFKD